LEPEISGSYVSFRKPEKINRKGDLEMSGLDKHFRAADSTDEFWKGLQKHMGFSDAELENFKNCPKRGKWAPHMASPAIQNSTLVFEVVESHACANGMKPGDKLYLQGCGLLDTKRSDPWCAAAFDCSGIANVCINLILHGIDPNDMYADHFSCFDCGTKYGWGQIIVKAHVIKDDPYYKKK